jgi:hypothetical protein
MNRTTDETIPCDGQMPVRQAEAIRSAARQPEVKSRSWPSFFMALLKEAILVRIAPRTLAGRTEVKSGLPKGPVKPDVLPHLPEPHPHAR